MKRAVWISAGVAAVLVLVGVGWLLGRKTGGGDDDPASKPVRIHGYVTLKLGQFTWDPNPLHCEGWKGYDDIKPGAQVVVTDAAGKTIAVGSLASGLPKRDPNDDQRAVSCSLEFNVDAPGGNEFYGVEVSHRGRLQYPPDRFAQPLELSFQ